MDVPRIVTELPGPKSRQYLELSRRYESRSLSDQVPVVWERAEGAVVEDVDGNRFIDFTSGVLVMNVGHCHPKHVAAIREQAGKLLNCYDFANVPRIMLSKKLVELTPPNLDRAFILTTGSEAIEAAIKIARRYTGRHEIISFHGAFHGRTYACMSVGGKMGVKRRFGPMLPGIHFAPFCYCYRCVFDKTYPQCNCYCLSYLDWLVETETTGDVAAVIVETYQGAAGSIIPPVEWMQRLEAWCRERDVLLIVDEVQASFGRTGKMFCFEHYGITPNLLCLGKGISCGVPCSAVVGESRIMDILEPGSMSSTNGGNPLSCAAALASIEIVEREGLCENAAKVGSKMLEQLKEVEKEHEIVGEARGIGLAIAVEIVKDKTSKEPAPDLTKLIIRRAFEKGLLLIAPIGLFGNVIRIAPPLVITWELAERGLKILADAIAEVEALAKVGAARV
ncbi:MAG: aspartate aminotransferase family protein [Armatimonadota bacterium]|nr:aspartate aminotransferase family protein [Armatimonadota bacterium]MCX7778420.1 aspartate aminotransferase family protein [Armatimonadota bacterium]MDW8025764.1 aspartate aminotransferase family protein [Armatimonadota bacterium]